MKGYKVYIRNEYGSDQSVKYYLGHTDALLRKEYLEQQYPHREAVLEDIEIERKPHPKLPDPRGQEPELIERYYG